MLYVHLALNLSTGAILLFYEKILLYTNPKPNANVNLNSNSKSEFKIKNPMYRLETVCT